MALLLVQDEGKQSLRTMDAVQENIRLKLDGFRMNRLLYGFNISVSFELPAIFRGTVGDSVYTFRFNGGERY